PGFGPLPWSGVLTTLHEGLPDHTRWLNEGEKLPGETARWLGNEFLLPRLPRRYDAWGIRETWKAPVLARLAADLTLAPGSHRFLVRARGLSRLWVNGVVVARTPALVGSSDGHEPVVPVAAPPLPGLRPAGFDQREVFGEAVIPVGGEC